MHVIFLGKFGDRFGPEAEIETDGLSTVADVMKRFDEDGALTASSTICVLDEEVVKPSAVIFGARELAFLPPVSGG
ncbi:MoaD/ThiS family protein [Parvularcula dongshanensis]|uniref:Molybdopterin converting factor small subunit n=1 Tax=Parvularcula dongshanensis TaxID=1173995 RepID=A0A840I6S2_9PROT|nr:MoaD/ThiS family protein [Parvularcula dongshanensis]MBB4660172.1 molybdopterin converting factor small subunit [Parvularcula dongshanensis]